MAIRSFVRKYFLFVIFSSLYVKGRVVNEDYLKRVINEVLGQTENALPADKTGFIDEDESKRREAQQLDDKLGSEIARLENILFQKKRSEVAKGSLAKEAVDVPEKKGVISSDDVAADNRHVSALGTKVKSREETANVQIDNSVSALVDLLKKSLEQTQNKENDRNRVSDYDKKSVDELDELAKKATEENVDVATKERKEKKESGEMESAASEKKENNKVSEASKKEKEDIENKNNKKEASENNKVSEASKKEKEDIENKNNKKETSEGDKTMADKKEITKDEATNCGGNKKACNEQKEVEDSLDVTDDKRTKEMSRQLVKEGNQAGAIHEEQRESVLSSLLSDLLERKEVSNVKKAAVVEHSEKDITDHVGRENVLRAVINEIVQRRADMKREKLDRALEAILDLETKRRNFENKRHSFASEYDVSNDSDGYFFNELLN